MKQELINRITFYKKVFGFLFFIFFFSITNLYSQCSSVTQLAASNINTNSVQINWVSVSCDSFLVRYYVTGTSTIYYKTIKPGTSTNTTLTGLTPNTNYSWLIKTYCNGGQSGPYQSVAATFSTINCPIPATLSTTNITNTSAKLKWGAVSADSLLVRYAVTGTSTYSYVTVAGSATSRTVTGLYPNTNYSWQVKSYCSSGKSGAYQATASTFTTLNSAAYCLVPNLVSTSNITANSAKLNWNPLVSADSFMVRYNVSGSSTISYVTVAGSSSSVTLSGLNSSTAYEWVVKGLCNSGSNTAYSSTSAFTTLSSSCGTPNVALFSSTSITSSSATVGWVSISGAQSYNVKYSVRYANSWTTVTSTTNSKAISGLQSSTWYEFQVQTVCASGTSAWSSSGIFQTLSSTLSLVRGPYLQLATTNSIYIRWRTSIPATSKVSYGTSTSNYAWSKSSTTLTTEHAVQLTGLSANTRYYYTIGSTTTVLQGDANNYFWTHPSAGATGPTRIWAIGDFGVGSSQQTNVRNAYTNYAGSTHTNVWLWLGDNAYPDGTDAEYQSYVFNYYDQVFKKFVVWPTAGNHDLHSANSISQTGPYYDIFTLPKNGEAGGVASGTEAYYSFNYANIHFVCLESYTSSLRSATGAMANWLQTDLQNNSQRWTVVYFHHPPYSKGSHDSDNSTELVGMRQNIVPILENYKVDLVLSGHSHAYERSFLLKGHYGLENSLTSAMKVSSGSGIYPNSYTKSAPSFNGTVYVVCGVAGQVGATSTGWPHDAMYTSTNTKYGSLVIDVNGDRLDSKFLLSDGSVWDQFTIMKSGNAARFSETQNSSNTLTVFPNPAKSDFAISLPEFSGEGLITLYDINNKMVYEKNLNKSEKSNQVISLNKKEIDLVSGVYVVKVITPGEIFTEKLIIE